MFYKTLHWYVLRELLRIFLMAAAVLTMLFAFGGSFRSLTKGGFEIVQLLWIMANLMPAMLAYTIPIAALFAAVLVYWRLSTDNELTACRASGISFWAVLTPALVLGLIVASVDLVFVNYVVPTFLQKTERLARADMGAILVNTIGQKETYRDPTGRITVYADDARVLAHDDPILIKDGAAQRNPATPDEPSKLEKMMKDPDVTFVQMLGVAVAKLKNDGKPQVIVSATRVVVAIHDIVDKDETQITIPVIVDATAYDPTKFQLARGDFQSLAPFDKPYTIASFFRNRPKFSNLRQLDTLRQQPWNYEPVRKQLTDLAIMFRHQAISDQLMARFKAGSNTMEFINADDEIVIVNAPKATQDSDHVIRFESTGGPTAATKKWVLVEVQKEVKDAAGRIVRKTDRIYRADKGDISLDSDDLSPVSVTMNLRGQTIELQNNEPKIPFRSIASVNPLEEDKDPTKKKIPVESIEPIAGLELPKGIRTGALFLGTSSADFKREWEEASKAAADSGSAKAQKLQLATKDGLSELENTIVSELNSRASFAVSCLTLVLFALALGVMLRGRKPLAVFVLGFQPSVLLVLLITMGRRVMETAHANPALGYSLLWGGNGVLLILVAITYGKLTRT